MRALCSCLLILFLGLATFASESEFEFDPTAPGEMTPERFANPPVSVRPWAYYWQLKGNFSKELITRDLENMASIGLGGMLVFDSRRYWDDYASTTHVPVPLDIKYEFMSDGWVEMMTHLVSEADRLGLQVSFNISDSGGQLRGPWDMKELGPRGVVWTEGNLNGPKSVSLDLSAPEKYEDYRDFAILAVRITSSVSEQREVIKLNNDWDGIEDATGFKFAKGEMGEYDKVVDLTDLVQDGKLDWDVPEGHWKVLRFGSIRIGEPGCVDVLNAKSVEDYFYKTPNRLLDAVGDCAGRTLSHFYNVSWEGVHPTWTDGFDKFFAEKRGYEMRSYLPILRGLRPIGDISVDGTRFIDDYARTISDAFCANCYETIGRLCHDRGARWHSEDGGPWNRTSPLFQNGDMLSFWGQNDFPQGEFWLGDFNRSNAAYASMAAHIYGRRNISLEAFTHMSKHWSIYPALMKPYADKNFIDGANMMIMHTYTASPEELGKPGFEYFAGTHINSNVTWQPYLTPFLNYMARCQLLLRQGVNDADVCVYSSDKNYVSWGRAETWNKDSKLTPPKGWRYDLLDTKVLVERMKYEDGLFVLPGGAKYRLLVFDPNSEVIPASAMRKLRELAEAGAPILLGETRPTRSIGLSNWREADAEVREIADQLWNAKDSSGQTLSNVYRDRDVAELLSELGCKADFEGGFEYVARSTEDAKIYFLSGEGASACVFRAFGKATLWDPMDGTVKLASCEQTEDGRSKLELSLTKNGAIFVVFSDSVNATEEAVVETRSDVFEVSTPWTVRFDPKVGGPESAVFDKLSYWNESEDVGIKYYSGVAVYSTEFELDEAAAMKTLVLSLGEVRDIARVKLNGQDLGIAWTDPWEVKVAGAAKAGKNVLEIEVANCWRNRLIGDAGLEPEERFTKTNVVLQKEGKMPAYRGYVSTDPLEPSGLIGPVKFQAIESAK